MGWVEYEAYQEAVGQPSIHVNQNGGDKTDPLVEDDVLVRERPGDNRAGARETTIIDVRKGLDPETLRGEHRHKQEHDCGMDHEWPLDSPLLPINGIQ